MLTDVVDLHSGISFLGFPGGSAVKNPTMKEMRMQALWWEDYLEKETATHFSILAWEIPWTEKPGGLQSMGPQSVRHNLATTTHSLSYCRLGIVYKLVLGEKMVF